MLVNKRIKKKRGCRKHVFVLSDYAEERGVSVKAVSQAIYRGILRKLMSTDEIKAANQLVKDGKLIKNYSEVNQIYQNTYLKMVNLQHYSMKLQY